MPGVKRHHFIPVRTQKRFLALGEDRLFAFDKNRPELGIARRAPVNLFVEGHLYSKRTEDGGRDSSLEDEFAALELAANEVIDRVIREIDSNVSPTLSAGDRELLGAFLVYQHKRVPEFFKNVGHEVDFRAMIMELLAKHEAEYGSAGEEMRQRFLSDEWLAREMHNARLDGVAGFTEPLLSLLRSRGLMFARVAAPRKQFILGSVPFARFFSPNGKLSLLEKGSEIWMPISPLIAMGINGPPNRHSVIHISDANDLRKVNIVISRQSQIIASSSEALIRSLMHFKPAAS